MANKWQYIRRTVTAWMMMLWMGVGCCQAMDMTVWQNISVDGQRNTVYCIAPQKDGSVLLGTGTGLYRKDESTLRHIGEGDWSTSRMNAILPMGERIYLGSNAGLMVYDPAEGSMQVLDGTLGEVRSLVEDGETMWIGSTNGVFIVESRRHPTAQACGDPVQPRVESRSEGLPNQSVYCLLKDSRGDVYAGTFAGLARWSRAEGRFERVMPEEMPNATSSFVNSIVEAPDGKSLLVGIHEALYRYEPESDRWTAMPFTGKMSIKCMAVRGDEVLIGCGDGLYALQGEQVSAYKHDGQNAQTIADNAIWSIATDGDGNLFVGHSRGLSVAGSGQVMRTIAYSDLAGTGEEGEVHAILRDREGVLWLGGTNGVLKVESRKSRGPHKPAQRGVSKVESKVEHLLANVMIRAIYEDSEGRLWFATDDGLKLYLPDANDFCTYHVTDAEGGHEAAWVYAVQEDSTYIYIGSYLGGLHRIAKSRLNGEGGKLIADESYNTTNSPMPNDLVRGIVATDAHTRFVLYYETDQVTRITSDGVFTPMDAAAMPAQPVVPQGYFCMYKDEATGATYLGGSDVVVEMDGDELSSLVEQLKHTRSPLLSWWAIVLYLLFVLVVAGNFVWFTYRKRHHEQKAAAMQEELQEAISHVKQRLTKTKDFIVPESEGEKQLRKIVRTVDENSFDSNLNVNTLSEKTGISPKQLYRIIKKEMNMSPLEYINSVRLSKAAKMLKEHKFSVSEVCYTCGFSTPSYFTKCFQDKFGCKPSEY